MMEIERLDEILAAEPRLEAAIDLARRAGGMARARFRHARVSWKPDESMVTDADLEIQAMLEAELAQAFPQDDVLGEEEPDAGFSTARFCWVLDPIDGTNNFGRGMPGFSVSIGLLDDGRPFAGAVYDPIADQLFAGLVGWGAWLNGRPLRLEPAELSRRSLCSIRAPFGDRVPVFAQKWLSRYRLRRGGSTALTLCYVALGALAFAHDHRASLWDIAGAVPVLLEAGGVITGPDGADLFPIRGHALDAIGFLAGDPLAHHQSLSDIRALG